MRPLTTRTVSLMRLYADRRGVVGSVPAVGDELASPLDRAAGAANSLAEAGRAQQEAVENLAITLVVLLLIVPLGLILFVWLPLRIRWIRRATFATALRRVGTGRDLLALRALANQPLRTLAAIGPDPANAWRDADASTVDRLAALELPTLGLRG